MLGSLVLMVALGAVAGSLPEPVVVEASSPAVSDGKLIESIGIETLGGLFTEVLPAGSEVPCEKTEMYSTAGNRQREIRITLFRGREKRVAADHRLGTFAVRGFRLRGPGQPKIAITISVAEQRIELRAVDQQDLRPLLIVRLQPRRPLR